MRIDRVKFAAALATRDIKAIELAQLSGVSRGTVTAIRSGKSCSEDTANKIAAGLGVPVEDILADAHGHT